MPRLTEQEQPEIVRFLEAGKLLPDKKNQVAFHDGTAVEVKPRIEYPPDKGGQGG